MYAYVDMWLHIYTSTTALRQLPIPRSPSTDNVWYFKYYEYTYIHVAKYVYKYTTLRQPPMMESLSAGNFWYFECYEYIHINVAKYVYKYNRI